MCKINTHDIRATVNVTYAKTQPVSKVRIICQNVNIFDTDAFLQIDHKLPLSIKKTSI